MSASKFPQVKYLPSNKEYHFNIIFDEDSDTLGLAFVEFLVQKLEDCYGTKCYYCQRDAYAGKSVFSEFFRGVESSIWTLVIVTNGFSKNGWANYCKNAAFYDNIVINNANKLIPILIGDAVMPKELKINTALYFHSDKRYWDDEKKLKKLEKLLENELVSQRSSADVLDVPVTQMTSAEVTQKTTYSIGRSQPGTDSGASNSHSLNNPLETDSQESQNIKYERQRTTGSQSPSPSSMSYGSLSSDPDLTCDHPPTSQEVQTSDADYDLSKPDQYCNPNTLKQSGKSLAVDSSVNSLSNDPNESTNPEQIPSTSGGGMTPAYENSPPSQKNLNTQERVDQEREERTRPDGCDSDDAASDSAGLKSMSSLSRWKSTIIVRGSHIMKPIINGFTRTDSFI